MIWPIGFIGPYVIIINAIYDSISILVTVFTEIVI